MLATVLLLALTNRNMPEAGDRQLAEFRSRDRLWSTPNLGLLTVAALLPDSFEITYVDQTFEAIPERGFTYVLLSPSTAQAPEAYRIADHYRRRGSRVLMGGPHVTVCPEEAARHAAAQDFEHLISDLDTLSRGLYQMSRMTGEMQPKN